MLNNSSYDSLFSFAKYINHKQPITGDEPIVFSITEKTAEFCLDSSVLSGAFCILSVIKGTIKFSVDYHTGTMHSGNILFLTPRMVLSLKCPDNDFTLYGICFSPAYFDDLSSRTQVYNYMTSFLHEHSLPLIEPSQSATDTLLRMLRLFSDINTAQSNRNGMFIHLSNLFLLQFSELLHAENNPSGNDRASHAIELYRTFRILLADHYNEEHYIAYYAARLNISSAYLSRIVRKISGRTVNYHITHLLLTEARRMLDCTDNSVKQIADKLGFADQASFGKFFKEQMKLPPTAYRKKRGAISTTA